jgi:predicted NodU family carbamoyl transferase
MRAVLGVTGSHRNATVALGVDGRLVAAASEDSFVRVPGIGYSQTGGFPSEAADACLNTAGVPPEAVREIAVVEDHGPPSGTSAWAGAQWAVDNGASGRNAWRARLMSLPVVSVDPLHADASLAAATGNGADAVLVVGPQPPHFAAFAVSQGTPQPIARGVRWEELASTSCALARALGALEPDPYAELERTGSGAEPEFLDAWAEAIFWRAPLELGVDQQRVSRLIGEASASIPGELDDVDSPNIRVQACRRALAASFMARVADLVCDAAEHVRGAANASCVALGGALFENPRLNMHVNRRMANAVSFAAIPGSRGRAIGAALACSPRPLNGLGGLALGPSFSEQDIKVTLENCRLDYMYEPDWRRLLVRISKMLSRGVVIGWFHGPAPLGRSLGTRSILCDPSTPYARENLNVYLQRLPMTEPLPVSMTPAAADQCLMTPVRSPYVLFDAPVADSARARVRAALDHRHHVRIHTVTTEQAPELCELLDLHFDRTRVPGLININLSGPGEPMACTPRDAVRTFFSSAVDALVIGRFLLMKDYWLLRSNVD